MESFKKNKALEKATIYLPTIMFVFSLFYLKKSLIQLPLQQLTFYLLLIETAFKLPVKELLRKRITPLPAKKDFVLSILLTSFYYCLLFALKELSFSFFILILLSAPFFTPWILNIWIKKRIETDHLLFVPLLLISFALFIPYLKFQQIAALLCMVSGLIFISLFFLGKKRFYPKNKPVFWPLIFSVIFCSCLLFPDPLSYSKQSFLYLGIYTLLKAGIKWIKLKNLPFHQKRELSSYTLLVSLTLPLILEPSIFFDSNYKSLIIRYVTAALVLFIIFFQKNILPNPLNEL